MTLDGSGFSFTERTRLTRLRVGGGWPSGGLNSPYCPRVLSATNPRLRMFFGPLVVSIQYFATRATVNPVTKREFGRVDCATGAAFLRCALAGTKTKSLQRVPLCTQQTTYLTPTRITDATMQPTLLAPFLRCQIRLILQ